MVQLERKIATFLHSLQSQIWRLIDRKGDIRTIEKFFSEADAMAGWNNFQKKIILRPEMSLILCERPIENSVRFNKIAIRSNSTIYFFSVRTEFRQILVQFNSAEMQIGLVKC